MRDRYGHFDLVEADGGARDGAAQRWQLHQEVSDRYQERITASRSIVMWREFAAAAE